MQMRIIATLIFGLSASAVNAQQPVPFISNVEQPIVANSMENKNHNRQINLQSIDGSKTQSQIALPHINNPAISVSEAKPASDYNFGERVKVYAPKRFVDPKNSFNHDTIAGKIANFWIPVGIAKNVSAELAARQILPPGWTLVDKADGRLQLTKVSWKGNNNKYWLEHLDLFAKESGVSFLLDLPAKQLIVNNFETTAKNAPTFFSMQEDKRKSDTQLDQEFERGYQKNVWILKPTKTLKENLNDWVKAAGWNGVAFEAEDYPVAFEVRLNGSWDSENGPIAQLAALYSQAKIPLAFNLKRGNKVLVVENAQPSMYSLGDYSDDAQRRKNLTVNSNSFNSNQEFPSAE